MVGLAGCSLLFPISDDAAAGRPAAADDGGTDGSDAANEDDATGPTDASAESGCIPVPSFAEDPNHCGACGHSCLGGSCKDSTCAPVTLVNGQTGAHWLALSTKSIFWTDGTYVRSCPKAGCDGGVPIDVATGRQNVMEIAAGAGQVFWTECERPQDGAVYTGGAYACPEVGCEGQTQTFISGSCLSAIAVDPQASLLYFGTTFDLFRCSVDGCSFAASSMIASAQYGYVASITLHQGTPFWLEAQRGVSTCASPNCIPEGGRFIAQSLRNAIAPAAIHDGVAYWTTYFGGPDQRFNPGEISQIVTGNGTVVRAPLDQDGGAAEVLTSGGSPTALVADDAGIRFTDFLGGVIYACPPSGCDAGPSPIAVGQGKPYALVHDDVAIYWANWGDGRIMKLAK